MSVKICIHQAADKIGGNCVEIVSEDGRRLLLDAGRPLELESGQRAIVPPSLDTAGDIEGLFLSHSHADHCGLLTELPGCWPVYCGQDTERLLRLNPGFERQALKQTIKTWPRNEAPALEVGPFTIRPRLMDHSAFDAYALLIEVDGRRIFYTGDFRDHGRKGKLTRYLLANPPQNIDALIMEGTNLSLEGRPPKPLITESELEAAFLDLFKAVKGRVFVTWSASNIDRMVTLYRACKRAGRLLVVDLYCATVWQEMRRFASSLPDLIEANLIRVVVTKNMVSVLGRLGYDNPVPAFIKAGVAMAASALENQPDRWVLMVRNSLARSSYPARIFPTADDAWVWSQWRGYLNEDVKELQEFMAPCGQPHYIHTSGHASPELLRDLAVAVAPRHLMPIHGEAWARHQGHFANLCCLNNGQWLEI